MRIWSMSPRNLCNKHLLAEHKELHGIYTVITDRRKGYSNHPEVKRWNGRLCALAKRHNAQVRELARRGFKHRTPLVTDYAERGHADNTGSVCNRTPKSWSTKEAQFWNLVYKHCSCNVMALIAKRSK